GAGGLGVTGIDRHIDPGFYKCFDDRENTGLLVFNTDSFSARRRRLAADVDNIGPRIVHAQPVINRLASVEVLATIRERIVSHVQDAHDQRTIGWQILKRFASSLPHDRKRARCRTGSWDSANRHGKSFLFGYLRRP